MRSAVRDRRVRALVAFGVFLAFALATLLAHADQAGSALRGPAVAAHAVAKFVAHSRHNSPRIELRSTSTNRVTHCGGDAPDSAFDSAFLVPVGPSAERTAEYVRALSPQRTNTRVIVRISRSPRVPRAPPFVSLAAPSR